MNEEKKRLPLCPNGQHGEDDCDCWPAEVSDEEVEEALAQLERHRATARALGLSEQKVRNAVFVALLLSDVAYRRYYASFTDAESEHLKKTGD